MKFNHNIYNMQNGSAWYYHACLSLGNKFSRIISVLYGSGLELKGGHSCKITNVKCCRKGEVSTLESSWSQIQWQTDIRGRPQLLTLLSTKCFIAVFSEVAASTGLSTNPLDMFQFLWPDIPNLHFPACSYLPTHCHVSNSLLVLNSPPPVFPFPTPTFVCVPIPIVTFLFT